MRQPQYTQKLPNEVTELHARLAEMEETLSAIRQGRVDAIVMDGPRGEEIATLQGADQPYRVMIESMQEGAVTLTEDGTILYSNNSFARLVQVPLEQVVGARMAQFIAAADQTQFAALLEYGLTVRSRGEVQITTSDGVCVPVLLSLTSLRTYEVPAVCVLVTDLTDQKRYAELEEAQKALQESERRFRAIFEQTFQFIWQLTPEGVVLEANQSALIFVGRTAAEVIGQPFWETAWWTGSPATQQRMREAIRVASAGEFVRYEVEICGADRQTAVIDFSLKPVRDESGSVVLLIPEGRNITEHRLAENARRESEAKFATAFQLNPLPMALMTMGGRYVEVNDAAERSFGYSRTEMLGRTSVELGLHPNPQRWKTFHQLLQQDGCVREFEALWFTKTGELRTFLISAEPLILQGKRYVLAVNNDITARKQDEEARVRLAAIVESSDDAIISKSLDGIVTSWNAAAERLFGYRAEEMVGYSIRRILPPDRQHEEDQILERLRRGEQIDHFETVRQTKDGRRLEVSVTISPIRDAHGTIIGASKIARDITARKQAEVELQRINEELQQFSYIVSHDLNEPLRTMGSYVHLLAQRLQGQLDSDAEEDMAFVTDAAQRMQQMLTDLLAYTRAGQTLEFQTVDCEAVLTDVLDALQSQIEECGAIITHDPLPTVPGEATRLGQVFQNLIGNALKFCTEPPRVHISVHQEDHQWRFAVRDNGIGIDPTQGKRLFQVFQRLHTRSAYPGTGIGLAICKKIVEQHGGRIWVESRPNEGSIFSFTIKDSQEPHYS